MLCVEKQFTVPQPLKIVYLRLGELTLIGDTCSNSFGGDGIGSSGLHR